MQVNHGLRVLRARARSAVVGTAHKSGVILDAVRGVYDISSSLVSNIVRNPSTDSVGIVLNPLPPTPLPLRRFQITPSLLPPAPSSHNAVAQARMDRFSSFAQSHYPRKFMAHHQVFDELGSPEDLEADARADQDRCPLRVRVRLVSPQAHVQQRA